MGFQTLVSLRKEGDSNPRYGYPHNGFRDRPVQPLRHLSLLGCKCTKSEWFAVNLFGLFFA